MKQPVPTRRSVGRFLRRMCTPWGNVDDAWQSVGGLLLNLATLFIPTGAALIGAFRTPWGWVVASGALLLLALLAGTRLQAEKDERETYGFDIDHRVEFMGSTIERPVGPGQTVPFHGLTKLWVRVRTTDRGGEFSAWCLRPRGMSRGQEPVDAEHYEHRAAWEETNRERFTIGYRGNGRLQPVWLFTDPPCLWFVLPQQDTYGDGHSIGPSLTFTEDDVGFDLRVVNETREVAREWRFTLHLDDNGSLDRVECKPLTPEAASAASGVMEG